LVVVRSERRYLTIPIVVSARRREVTEVMMNGPDDVYVERKGRLEKIAAGGAMAWSILPSRSPTRDPARPWQ